MSHKTGLGRGLDSLIPGNAKRVALPKTSPVLSGSGQDQVIQADISLVHANPNQPRKNFSPQALEELAGSIKEHGIIQPLIVSKTEKGYQIIAGERRFRAAKMVGLETLPVIVRKAEKQKELELSLIENIQRENLNPVEEGVAYQRLLNEFNLSHEDLAKRVGKSRPVVTNAMRLLNLPQEIQKALIEGKISFSVARFLSGVPEKDRMKYFKKALNDGLKVNDLTEQATLENIGTKTYKKRAKDPNLVSKEEELQQILGTMVTIAKTGDAGKIMISFYSEEELHNLIEKLKGKN